jgi:putative flippase GtrA
MRDGMQAVRFLVAGGTGFGLYMGIAMLLGRFTSFDAGLVAWLAVMMAVVPMFVIQRLFTFRSRGPVLPQLGGYTALQLVSSVAVAAAAHGGGLIGLDDRASYALAGLAGVAISYLIQSKLIFPA